MEVDKIRKEYMFAELTRKNINSDPIKQFAKWLNEAIEIKASEATAMSLITVGEDGFPQSRIVLLKGYNEKGFTFFTNYNSQKGWSIQNNPKVGIHFFWPELERQIRISGYAKKTSDRLSDGYFHSRPITSQLAACISNQSDEIPSRKFLEDLFFDLQDKLKGETPQRPETWGGFIVSPLKLEFWQGRESRLHDRILYEKQDDDWITKRLAP